MNTPQILTGQQALDQFGLNALIECRVAVTTELNGLGHSVMVIGVIADPDSCQIDEDDTGVLWVEYQVDDNWYLYSIPADEQFVLLDDKNNPPASNEVLARRVVELTRERDAALASSLTNHLERQIAFSIKAFGPNKRTGGIIDHMKKELVEVANAPDDITEWIDLAMLALDGAWRQVDRSNLSFAQVAELVQKTLTEKLAKNEGRNWPDWRQLSEDKAIEHDRSNEPEDDDPAAIAVMAGHYEDLAQSYEQLKAERDAAVAKVKELQRDIKQRKLIHIGFTNDAQVQYVTEDKEDGAFYPDSDNECYIPVYMLDVHAHRVGYESVIYCENIRMKQELSNLPVRDAEIAKAAFIAGVEWLKDLPAFSVAGLDAAIRQHINQLGQQAKAGAA